MRQEGNTSGPVQKFHLVCLDAVGVLNLLMHREKQGCHARCIQGHEGPAKLHELYATCGHFATRTTLSWVVSRHHWPSRYEDIAHHCKSCHSCQLIGPSVPRELPLSIAFLEPIGLQWTKSDIHRIRLRVTRPTPIWRWLDGIKIHNKFHALPLSQTIGSMLSYAMPWGYS